MHFEIDKIEDWQTVADKIIPEIKHNILLLKGNLGAGKTTFTQVLVAKLDSKDEVSSPTYTIVNEYYTPQGIIYHFDLYRLKTIEEVFDIGMEEYLDHARLCIIEWPEIYEPELEGLPHHEIKIENVEGNRCVDFI